MTRQTYWFPGVRAVLLIAMVISLDGCVSPGTRDVPASVKALMLEQIIPASTQIFTAAGDPPTNDEQWAAIGRAAGVLGESGRTLRLSGIYPTGSVWGREANALINASQRIELAARDRQEAMLVAAGDAAYESCEACHQDYLKVPDRAR